MAPFIGQILGISVKRALWELRRVPISRMGPVAEVRKVATRLKSSTSWSVPAGLSLTSKKEDKSPEEGDELLLRLVTSAPRAESVAERAGSKFLTSLKRLLTSSRIWSRLAWVSFRRLSLSARVPIADLWDDPYHKTVPKIAATTRKTHRTDKTDTRRLYTFLSEWGTRTTVYRLVIASATAPKKAPMDLTKAKKPFLVFKTILFSKRLYSWTEATITP
jgi:hypothetical protein